MQLKSFFGVEFHIFITPKCLNLIINFTRQGVGGRAVRCEGVSLFVSVGKSSLPQYTHINIDYVGLWAVGRPRVTEIGYEQNDQN